MFQLSDLLNLKEENQKAIAENNAVIEEKKVQNRELEAENRVFDKLINLCQPKEPQNALENNEVVEQNEQIC